MPAAACAQAPSNRRQFRALPPEGRGGACEQPPAQLRQQPTSHLYEELERRPQGGPVVFAPELEFAEDGDPTDDRTVLRPEGRERMASGRLELTRPVSWRSWGTR